MVYDALLQHLDDEKIQKTLCEILCHLTAAANARLSCDVVKQWRVNRVFAVRNRVGSFPEIDFLLNIYQITKPDYFPKAFNTRFCPLTKFLSVCSLYLIFVDFP